VLSFNSTLVNKLKLRNAQTFWCLKLYYNDESAFVGMSDTHRVDGSDIYYGLVTDWGNYSQTLDIYNFTTSIGNMAIKLVNADNTFQDGRFSDQLSSKNFENRKWELFQCVHGLTYDTSANMIATGVISGAIEYNRNEVSIQLLDMGSRYHNQIPYNKVTSGSYANAPDNNFGKPIPMNYGDFHDKTDIGTIPTSGAEFDRYFTKGKFPAIITDKFDETNATIEALVDSQTPHTLDSKNIYMYDKNFFIICEDANTTASGSTITAKEMDWRVYAPMSPHNTYSGGSNYANTIDNDFSSTPYALSQTGAGATSVGWRLPKISKLGEFTAAKLLIAFGSFTGSAPNTNFRVAGGAGAGGSQIATLTWDGGDQTATVTSQFSSDKQSSWDIETEIFLTVDNTGGSGNMSVDIDQIGLEIQFEPSQSFSKQINEISESTERRYNSRSGYIQKETVDQQVKIVKTKTLRTPANVDYLYFSGKGRKYGAWADADSRNNGYNENDLIENPIYMIEDCIRNELKDHEGNALTSSHIDYASFDTSGNTSDGTLGDAYNDSVGDVEFAMSQYKFTDSQDFIEKICRQCLSWVFINGAGKFKIVTRRGADNYSAEDQSIDYNDITLDVINKTAMNSVRNDFIINYNFDAGQNQSMSQATASDATSQGSTSSGFFQTLSFEMDSDAVLDSTTATKLAESYRDFMKQRWTTIMFDAPTAKYNHLEIGDVINFDNWDSSIKLYGTAMDSSNHFFMIDSINKRPNGCEITCTEVSD